MANTLPTTLGEIVEYRGVRGLVAAEVTLDNNQSGEGQGYVTGTPFAIAGVAEISRTTDASQEAHYYDNIPAVVISSNSGDEVTINTSAIPLDVLAELTGQVYNNGAFIEGERVTKYFALGYITKRTDGTEMYVWRYKGTFNIPDSTHSTEDDSTDANGQELVYTGISTTHKFTNNNNKGAKAMTLDSSKGSVTEAAFFASVYTPDSVSA